MIRFGLSFIIPGRNLVRQMLPLFLFAICRVPDVFLHSVGQQQPDGITDVTDNAFHCFTPLHIVSPTLDIGQPQYSQAPDESPVLMEPLGDAINATQLATLLSIAGNHELGAVCRSQFVHLSPYQLNPSPRGVYCTGSGAPADVPR